MNPILIFAFIIGALYTSFYVIFLGAFYILFMTRSHILLSRMDLGPSATNTSDDNHDVTENTRRRYT